MKRSASVAACAMAVLWVGLAGGARAADETAARTTLDNLQAAFNGESNAKARYEAFAAKANEEGYKSIATLFRAAALSESIHATNFAGVIRGMGAEPKATLVAPDVKSTKENLEAAVKGETSERDTLYPACAKQAEADKNDKAVMMFKGAQASEAGHAAFFQQALDHMDAWKQPGKMFAVCAVCGFTGMGKPPQKCPVCAAPKEKFIVVK